MSDSPHPEVYLARHGETAWAVSGQHTGLTDIPLTDRGERNARELGERLDGISFDHVFTSPLIRAVRTSELAGFGGRIERDPELVEWDYGDYEGLKSAEIREKNPGWDLFRDGSPGGESVQAVGARADRVVARLRKLGGRTLLFGHGHFTRVLATRWLGLPVDHARLFLLGTASLSIIGYDHNLQEPALRLWNANKHVT